MLVFYAHTGSQRDKSDWQTQHDHSHAVADLAAAMARPFGLDRAARVAGLFHDLGKYTQRFQRRLNDEDIRVDHSTAGAAVLGSLGLKGGDKDMAELIAYCILGHHAGLPDRLNATEACFDARLKRYALDPELVPDPVWKAELTLDTGALVPTGFETSAYPAFQLSVMTRMIFSCLVDADYKDTEAFYAKLEIIGKDRDWPALQDLLPEFVERFDAHMAGMGAADNDLNRLRGQILAHVRAKSTEKPGLFTLTVPTGGGKTLVSLGFALDHALAHGHRRIIYAIPFTSIIDQAAVIFRSILGDDNVLEHHSAIDEEKGDSKRKFDSRDKLKLAMEDWAAPVVVTTNVQFFESLFAAKTSRARKLHNIANSVIILDEAQTIPRPLLMPAIRMLEELALNYGCTIVLCTATQPALDDRNLKKGLPLSGRELAPDPHGLAQKLRRATIRQAGPMGNDDLIVALSDAPQALVIVNSRKHALELFREAQQEGLGGLVHLTTRQYAAHRREILKDVRQRLKDGLPCRVIATSLIEAGVDVDFPKVWRAEAGLDSIIQAAGRCNREGKRGLEDSIVTVFAAPDYPPPREIKGLLEDMQRMLIRQKNLLSLDAIEDYFSEVYWRMGDRLDGKKILDQLKAHSRGTDFAFRQVADDFRMIENAMVPVIITRDEIAKKAVDELSIERISSGALARRLQTYIVQVPPKARDLLIRNGHVAFVRPDLRGDQFAVLRSVKLYEEDVGLRWDQAEYLALEGNQI